MNIRLRLAGHRTAAATIILKMYDMPHSSFIRLHALPDLSLFQYRTGYGELLLIRLRFTRWRSGVFDLSIEQEVRSKVFYPYLISEDEAAGILYTVVQVMEFYTDRYTRRVIRLSSGASLQNILFRSILRNRDELLCPLFSIGREGRYRIFPFRRNAGDSVFLLKRRADSDLPSHPVRSSVNTRSRLFGNLVQVELHDDIDIVRPVFATV